MKRRTFLRDVAAAACAPALNRMLRAQASPVVPAAVTRVLLITKCHLDVGFTKTQAAVMRQYFDEYFPAAMQRSAEMRIAGSDRYTWTTGSWLLYEYLEQASASERKRLETAVLANDLSYHALPFSWQTEMLDRSMIEGGLGFAKALDARFGRHTIGAKMTDVPGHSRGIVAPLQDAGVSLLDIGVNAASTPPDVPDLFLWKDAAGHSLPVLYHRRNYGSVLQVPGTSTAIAVVVRNDNSGPHTLAEIQQLYADLRSRFPGASVTASNLNEAATVVNSVRDTLPVVSGEIGDTWIYGVASDPEKVAGFRTMMRLRAGWLEQSKLTVAGPEDLRLLRRLLLAAEHTWGTDTKSYLDNDHYLPHDLQMVLDEPGYRTMTHSWQEKRDNITVNLQSLPASLRAEAAAELGRVKTATPATGTMHVHSPALPVVIGHFIFTFDSDTGAIVRLQKKSTGQEYASRACPLALFTYQTLSAQSFASFLARYVQSKESWAPRDFGKPGIERFGALDAEWHPRLTACSTGEIAGESYIALEMQMPEAALRNAAAACPARITLQIRCPADSPTMHMDLTLFDKQANRMPEAMWLTFQPAFHTGTLLLEKCGQVVNANDVLRGGGRHMHAVTGPVRFQATGQSIALQSIDAPLVAIGERSPLNFSLESADVTRGIHVGLFNNAWGTNYPQWAGGTWTYRFHLDL